MKRLILDRIFHFQMFYAFEVGNKQFTYLWNIRFKARQADYHITIQ